LAYSPALPAQESTTHWCFRGRPKPRCDVFWLTEFGVAAPISFNPSGASRGALFTWELGGMANRGTRHAFGVAAFTQAILWGSDQIGQRAAVGIRPRLRFWMSQTTSFDIAPGMVVLGAGAPGFSGHRGELRRLRRAHHARRGSAAGAVRRGPQHAGRGFRRRASRFGPGNRRG